MHSQNKREAAEKEEAAAVLQHIENELKKSGSIAVNDTNTNEASGKSKESEDKPIAAKPKTTKQPTDQHHHVSTSTLLFEKKIKVIQTEASKWKASEKVVVTPAEDLQSLLDGVKPKDTKRTNDNVSKNSSQETAAQTPKKGLFKKRKVSKN